LGLFFFAAQPEGPKCCLGLTAFSLFLAVKLAFGTIYTLHLGTDGYEEGGGCSIL
jgi:hypothetical protein